MDYNLADCRVKVTVFSYCGDFTGFLLYLYCVTGKSRCSSLLARGNNRRLGREIGGNPFYTLLV